MSGAVGDVGGDFHLDGLVVALALAGLELAAGGRTKLSGMLRALGVSYEPERKVTQLILMDVLGQLRWMR